MSDSTESSHVIDPALRLRWIELLRTDASAADRLYFAEILPAVLEHLEEIAEHRVIREEFQCSTLVSLMGYSPETTVIAASILRPERLVVITSQGKGIEERFDRAAEFLIGRRVITHSHLKHEEVDPTRPQEIYDSIRRHLSTAPTATNVVDVTGGKKVMSASAAQAAWELNLRLCYVESDRYSPELRRPEPGSERVLLLANPSQQRIAHARDQALSLYDEHSFARARDGFLQGRDLSEADTRFYELGALLCDCCSAWMDMDRARLREAVDRLAVEAGKPRLAKLLEGKLALDRHLGSLRAVADAERLALVATYLELAGVYRHVGRHDFACLLAYRAMEALVVEGLRSLSGGRFDADEPDYALLGDAGSLLERYVALSRAVDEDSPETALPRRLGLSNGYALLCVVDRVHERVSPGADAKDAVWELRRLAGRRNRSILAHGTETLQEHDSDELHRFALRLADAVLGPRNDDLRALCADLRPRALRPLL